MKEIRLTRGLVALVDDGDYKELSALKWYAQRCHGRFYAANTDKVSRKNVLMHRVVLKAKKGQIVDHVDGNPLNCQRGNLRFCSVSENDCNRGKQRNNKSGYKGVSWNKNAAKWIAMIKKGNKQFYLGTFSDIRDAARAYNQAAIIMHGAFAKLETVA